MAEYSVIFPFHSLILTTRYCSTEISVTIQYTLLILQSIKLRDILIGVKKQMQYYRYYSIILVSIFISGIIDLIHDCLNWKNNV